MKITAYDKIAYYMKKNCNQYVYLFLYYRLFNLIQDIFPENNIVFVYFFYLFCLICKENTHIHTPTHILILI